MKSLFGHKILGTLSLAFLFLCISCSHTKTNVSSLEGLSAEATEASESVETTDSTAQTFTESAPIEATAPVEEVAPAVQEKEASFAVPAENNEVKSNNDVAAVSVLPEPVSSDSVSSEPVAIEPATNELASAPSVSQVMASNEETSPEPSVSNNPEPNQKDRDISSKRKRKHRKHRRHRGKTADNLDIEELLNAYSNKVEKTDEKNKAELASADLTNFVEKNLFPLALLMVGGLIATFFAVRKTRKTDNPL